ncbi:MAG: hypothetical protein QOJ62_311 [Actinomycetota bacterium]|jgi:hypothetical protein|nr:hypothetical protein [Actinomycetota bacterium]
MLQLRVVLGGIGALALSLAAATPAAAHNTNKAFHTTLSSVSPSLPGITVIAADDGTYLEITNTTSTPVVVLGYENEPYLRITSSGVEQNTLSPATYLNESLQIGSVPTNVDTKAPPAWHQISTTPTAQWHDHRIHWMDANLPPVVKSAQDKPHLVNTWTVRALHGSQPIVITGTLSWKPVPTSSSTKVLGVTVAALLLAFVALALVIRWRRSVHVRTSAPIAMPDGEKVP